MSITRTSTSTRCWDVRMTDTSLRDGSPPQASPVHQGRGAARSSRRWTPPGVPVIEVTHGDGLGGSSFNYGFSKTPEQELIKLAAETAKESKIAFLMLPGVGTKEDIKEAQSNGGSICRIATHCTEADVSIQHFGLARELGPGDRRLPDDGHTISAGEARRPGPDHGRRGLPVRLRRRLRGCAGARGCRRPGRGAGRRAR